jgi:rhodanese-related sulfurtransferase
MVPTVLSRHSQLMLASLVVLFAIVMRSGGPAALGTPDAAQVSISEAIALIDAGALVIDVRASPKTHLPGALVIPLEVLDARLSQLEGAKAQSIVVYCGSGTSRGPKAAQLLTEAGFTRVVNLQPGIEGWRAAGLPVVKS